MSKIQKHTLDFLKNLKKNNNRDWFNTNKSVYLAALENFKEFTSHLLEEIKGFDQRVIGTEVKDSVFRIYRDIRFSKDKTPYKIYFGAGLGPGGRKAKFGEYYLHLEPGNTVLAAGMWAPDRDKLYRIRQEIDYNFEEFCNLINTQTFKQYYPELSSWNDKLVRPPKGYSADNPAIEFLKHKHFVAVHKIADKELLGKDFATIIIKAAQAALPLNQFLDRAVEEE